MEPHTFTLVEVARLFRYLREAGANAGRRVEAVQHWCGGEKGESWCCHMATLWLDVFFQGESPVPRGGLCQDVLDLARAKGWLVDAPRPGDLVISVNAEGHAHHIAVCTIASPLTAIAGNTSEDGKSSNGDRVAEHEVSPSGKVYVRVPGVR